MQKIFMMSLCVLLSFQCVSTRNIPIKTINYVNSEQIKQQFTSIKQKLLESIILNKKEINPLVYLVIFDRLLISSSPRDMTKKVVDILKKNLTREDKLHLMKWNSNPLAAKLEESQAYTQSEKGRAELSKFMKEFKLTTSIAGSKRGKLEIELNKIARTYEMMAHMSLAAITLIVVAKKLKSPAKMLSAQDEEEITNFIKMELKTLNDKWENKLLPMTIFNHKNFSDQELEDYVKMIKDKSFFKKESLEINHTKALVYENLLTIIQPYITPSANKIGLSFLLKELIFNITTLTQL